MKLGTPRSMQGRVILCAYGWMDGEYYKRSTDRTNLRVKWMRADEESRDRLLVSGYDADGENDPPDVTIWVQCASPV